MKDTEYTYAVARIRSNEYRLLTSADTEALIAAKSYDDCVSALNEKGYDIDGADYSPALSGRLDSAWRLVYEVLPDKSEFDSLIIKNDFANLKIMLKSLVTDTEADALWETPSVYDPAEIKKLVFDRRNDLMPEPLAHADRSAYRILTKTAFAQLADAVIDRAALEWGIALAKRSSSGILSRLAQHDAAAADIKVLYRCVKAEKAASFMDRSVCVCEAFDKADAIKAADAGMDSLLEFLSHTDYRGAAQALKSSSGEFEKWCDDRRTDILRGAKTETFGVGPIVAYYFATETEVRNVRVILSAKQTGLSETAIRQRVRNAYV